MPKFAESHVEDAALSWLEGLGDSVGHGPDLGPDGSSPERGSYGDVVLVDRLRSALESLNPHLPADTLDEAIKKIQQTETLVVSPVAVAAPRLIPARIVGSVLVAFL